MAIPERVAALELASVFKHFLSQVGGSISAYFSSWIMRGSRAASELFLYIFGFKWNL